MAPHSSTLAWNIPWTEGPGRLQSMGSLRVRHDWVTSLSFFTFMHWKGHGNPLQCSCLENPRDGGAWWAAVYGVSQSRTRLKRLSSSSSSRYLTFFSLFLPSLLSDHFPFFNKYWKLPRKWLSVLKIYFSLTVSFLFYSQLILMKYYLSVADFLNDDHTVLYFITFDWMLFQKLKQL